MTPRGRTWAMAGLLTLGSCLGLASSTAQAQPNTYADFPYNQGSLFYQYRGPRTARPSAARRARAPQTYYYRNYAPPTRQPVYQYTYPTQRGYYYIYGPPPVPTQSLFGPGRW
jgi:hypothetical protein